MSHIECQYQKGFQGFIQSNSTLTFSFAYQDLLLLTKQKIMTKNKI